MFDEGLLLPNFEAALKAKDFDSAAGMITPDLAQEVNADGQNALHLVAQLFDETIEWKQKIRRLSELLVSQNANVHDRDESGNTPLHYLIEKISFNPQLKPFVDEVNLNISNKEGKIPSDNLKAEKLGGTLDEYIYLGLNPNAISTEQWQQIKKIVSDNYDRTGSISIRTQKVVPQDIIGNDTMGNHLFPPPQMEYVNEIDPVFRTLLSCIDYGRELTLEDLPLITKLWEHITKEEPKKPLRRYALIQLEPLFQNSDLPNKEEYIDQIKNYQSKDLDSVVQTAKMEVKSLLHYEVITELKTSSLYKKRYLEVLSELYTQKPDSSIKKLYGELEQNLYPDISHAGRLKRSRSSSHSNTTPSK